MKRVSYCLAFILMATVLGGASCTSSKDPNIDKGRQLRQEGLEASQKTMEGALEKMSVAYRTSEKRLIDSNYARDIAGLIERAKTSNFTPEQLLSAQQQYIADRDAALAAVDLEIKKAMQVVQWARDDRALAEQVKHRERAARISKVGRKWTHVFYKLSCSSNVIAYALSTWARSSVVRAGDS